MENYKHPKMTIAEMKIIWEKCENLGIDPEQYKDVQEQYKDVQYAGKLIFDLTWLELCTSKIVPPNPADYKAGGKYDYTRY